jgi:uncharacterized protein YjbJ (UPF0337 family)
LNWDRIEGRWAQFSGDVKQQWGKLTDDQLKQVAGRREHLAGVIQEAYGLTKEQVGKQIYDWQKQLKELVSTKS